jgi:hypothetical protein
VRLATALVLAAAACAPPSIALPDEPAARAATCAAVRALELREGKAADGPVSFTGFTEILHFGMIAAAEDHRQVDLNQLMAVSQRAPAHMDALAGGEWRTLVEPCNAAFPETQKSAGALPNGDYEAGMTCFALTDFLVRTAFEYPEERRRLAGIADRALHAAQPVLRQRARDNDEAQGIAAGYTARAFRAGRPDTLIAQCARRFPEAG